MKKLLLSLALMVIALSAFTQIYNLNPDPNGEPWIVGGLRPLTAEDYTMLNKVPQWKPVNPANSRDLPTQLDNTVNPWFRPIFSQDGGSCGQASGVGYNFTYEIDYERNIPANITTNQYPTHFTWNFLNNGVGDGSWYFDGWVIIREAGCPNVATYGGMSSGGQSRWMYGYDKYYSAMFNRTLDFYGIDVSTYEGLNTLKQWLWSRDGGTLPGGLANFGAGIGAAFISALPAGTPNAGKAVVVQWGTTSDHAMTFVGYDDNIRYDFNNDGQYTTNLDINGDGNVDLRDCEIGGMLMANSWGTSFGFGGKAYVMYKLLADPIEIGGIWSNAVHIVQTKPDGEPLLTLKAKISHTSRNKLKIMAGVSTDPSATKPDVMKGFPLFNYQGGDFYMQGGSSNADKTIEIGLDITDLLTYVEPGAEARFFLQVVEQDPNFEGDGEIISCSLIDYINGTEEVISELANVPIANSDTTLLWMNKAINFDKVMVTTETLDAAVVGEDYSYQLEAAQGTPPYSWSLQMEYSETPIANTFPAITTNQLQPTNDDDGFAIQPIDFDFQFYGEAFNEVTILTDGAITFDGSFAYIREDASITSNRCIAGYCADLMIYPAQGDGIFYEGDETHATFRWKVSKFDLPNFNVDFAVTLYPDGKIEFLYGDPITPATGWSSGISQGDGNNYLITSISGNVNIPADFAAQIGSEPFPLGMSVSADGIFQGLPTEPDMTWNIAFKVTDYQRISNVKTLPFSTVISAINDFENNIENLVSVTPNPFSDQIEITFTRNEVRNASFVLTDIYGRKVSNIYDGKIAAGQNTISWSAAASRVKLTPGIYFLNWTIDEKSGTEKLIYSR